MAFTVVAGVNGQFAGAASATTLGIQAPSSTIPAGSLIVGTWVGLINSDTVSSIADNSTQAGAANVYSFGLPVLTGASLSFGFFWCLSSTRAILSSDTVTITLGTTVAQRCATLNAWTPGNNNAQFDTNNTAKVNNQTSSPVPTGAQTVNASSVSGLGVMAIGMLFPGAATTWAVTAPSSMTLGVQPVDPGSAPHVVSGLAWKDNIGVNNFSSNSTFTSITRADAYTAIFTDDPILPAFQPRFVRRIEAGG